MRSARGLCQLITALLQLSLVSRRVATVVLSANVLSPLFVRGLLLPLLVFYDALLCAVFPLRLRHVTLTTVLPTHVLPGLPNRSLSAWLSPDPSACRTRATSQGRFWRRKSWAPRAVSSFGRAARQSTSVLICFGLALAPSFLRAIRSIPSFGITKFAVNICSPDTNKNTNKSDGWDRREQTVTNTDVRGRAHFQRFPSTARTDADALEQA